MQQVWLVLLVGVCQVLSQDYKLVWEDNFDFLDFGKWQHEVTAWGGGNGEFQTYTNDPDLAYTRDGSLYIEPKMTADCINPKTGQKFGEDFLFNGILDLWDMYGVCTNADNNGCYRVGSDYIIPPAMSARLRSTQRFSFRYGRVEVRAKMPSGDWLWPAIWLLPETWVYGGWPMSGEIDIVEIKGNRDYVCDGERSGIDSMGTTLHWGLHPTRNRYYLTSEHRVDTEYNYADYYHNYTMEWDENGLRFILDDKELVTFPSPMVDENPDWSGFYDFGSPWYGYDENIWANGRDKLMTPFDEEFHFILNVAVGGTNGFIPDGCINRGGGMYNKPWSNNDPYAPYNFWGSRDAWLWTWNEFGPPAAMEVDYIKVWQKE